MSVELEQLSRKPETTGNRTGSVLPWFTPTGFTDRQHEAAHLVRMNDIRREANELAAHQAKQLMEELARQEAVARAVSDAKYKIHRAHMESRLLAGEDPILQAHFGLLDDTMATLIRGRIVHWR